MEIIELSSYTEIEKDSITNEDLIVGFIDNLPFEGLISNDFTGLTSTYLDKFASMTGVTYKYIEYKDTKDLTNALDNKINTETEKLTEKINVLTNNLNTESNMKDNNDLKDIPNSEFLIEFTEYDTDIKIINDGEYTLTGTLNHSLYIETNNEVLKEYLNSHYSSLCSTCKERLVRNPLRILDCKVDKDLEINDILKLHELFYKR